jgi:hypothetical protein
MKDVIVEKVNKGKDDKQVNPRWWEVKPDLIHESLFQIVSQIEKRQMYRNIQNLRHAQLYSNLEVAGLQAGMFNRVATGGHLDNRVTLNVVKSAIDTVASKIAKSKPKPLFLTQDGDFKLEQKAKNLTKYMEGAFEAMHLYEHKQRAFVDSGIFGTGEVKFYKEDGKVKCERILMDEIIVDDAEGMYGTPSQKHQTRFVSKDVLKAMFPDSEKEIEDCSNGLHGEMALYTQTNLVKVVESWKLKSGAKAKDGMHAMVIENCTLFSEKYERDAFPFGVQRWSEKITGYYGGGISEELIGIQLELNKLLRSVQVAQALACVPRVWVEISSQVNTQQLNNQIGGIGKYKGTPPIFSTASAMPSEIYQHILFLYQKAYEITGISQLSANSSKPSGLNSGAALREYQDIESDRFQLVGQRWEASFMEDARQIIELTKELDEDGEKPYVTVKDGKGIRTIKWKDVDMERDQYDMKIFPISMLPTQPAGKLQTVTELTQAGFIEKDQAVALLDFPDLEGFMSMKTAPLDNIKMMIGNMLDGEDYQSPEPYMNLQLALDMTQNAYLRARCNKTPEDRLDSLQRFMEDIQSLMSASQGPAMPGQPGQSGAGAAMQGNGSPQAVPAPAPVSQLLPNGAMQ